jgi:hypothetical protein
MPVESLRAFGWIVNCVQRACAHFLPAQSSPAHQITVMEGPLKSLDWRPIREDEPCGKRANLSCLFAISRMCRTKGYASDEQDLRR